MPRDGTTLEPPAGISRLAGGRKAMRRAVATVHRMAPALAAVVVALSGLILLLSGASPALDDRMRLLERLLPLSVVEVSHLASSLAGLWLLILARGLWARLSGAYALTMIALAVGAAGSLLKGGDIEEALVLAFAAGFLFASRDAFHRRSRLSALPFSPLWLGLVAVAIGVSVALGLFVYTEVSYSNQLWWEFAFYGDAPRFLRASLLVAVAAGAFALVQLLRTGLTPPPAPSPADIDAVEAVLATSPESEGRLALTGDKGFLFTSDRRAFVMYGVQGRSMIAFGDPVGPPDHNRELIRSFQELAHRRGARPVFYQVDGRQLERYVDLGFTCLKLGEEAHVDLAAFDLKGKFFTNLRNARNRAAREGLVFAVIPAAEVRALLPDLRAVSDAWLAEKNAREKAFSLGFFSEDYLCRTPVAVMRQGVDGPVVAFANLLLGAGKSEVSIDLMRHGPGAPNGTMDALFVEIAFWAKADGYATFNLGLAPLSGLLDWPLAPHWHRIGRFVFTRVHATYNFSGLRAYKEKFAPVWRSKYVAAPTGPDAYAALVDAMALVSGGIRGMLNR
jgi:phosphatidylglycerol lysyltransferase